MAAQGSIVEKQYAVRQSQLLAQDLLCAGGMHRVTLSLLVGALSCNGALGPLGTSAPVSPGVTPPAETPGQTPPAPSSVAPSETAFPPSRDKLVLLPFEVRLKRIADVAGVATSDAMLSELRARRMDLGAHDFGANVAPDLSWSAQRMTIWVQAIAPICDNASFKARFGDWNTGLKTFAPLAWGRKADAADLALLEQTIAEAKTDSKESQWRATCLLLLSSSELVAQ
jgi:hypothetical protein